jgi:hypothetical protein
MSRAKISISPVGRFAFTVSAVRALTSPSTRITHSPRTVSAILKQGESGSATTWVRP